MNRLHLVLIIWPALWIIGGCTYLTEEKPFSDVCQTNLYGFPEVPGWSSSSFEWGTSILEVSGFCFTTAEEGFLYGGKGIWKTGDQGESWKQVYADQYLGFSDFEFTGQHYGVASVTKNNLNLLLKTNDGGLSWSYILFPMEGLVGQISFVDSLVGFASINSMSNYKYTKTVDGGVTWQDFPELSAAGYGTDDIHFFTDGFGYMPGDKGEIHLTADYGATWTTVKSGIDELTQIQFVDHETGFAAGHNQLMKTIDAGETWTVISQLPINLFHFFTPLDGISLQVIHSGYLPNADWPQSCNAFLTTSDGGASWTEGPVSINLFLRNLSFVNEKLGYIVYAGYQGGVVKLNR